MCAYSTGYGEKYHASIWWRPIWIMLRFLTRDTSLAHCVMEPDVRSFSTSFSFEKVSSLRSASASASAAAGASAPGVVRTPCTTLRLVCFVAGDGSGGFGHSISRASTRRALGTHSSRRLLNSQ